MEHGWRVSYRGLPATLMKRYGRPSIGRRRTTPRTIFVEGQRG